jgi:hypothetical protein
MLRRLISIILVLVMLLSLFAFAYAQEVVQKSDKNYYVETGNIPNDVIEYAKNSIGNMLMGQYNSSNTQLLYPFKLFNCEIDLYYFMVYHNNEMIGSYRVFSVDGKYNGIFSEAGIFEKNILTAFSQSTVEHPAKILRGQYDDVYSIVNDKVYTIIDDVGGKYTELSYLQEKTSKIKLENSSKVLYTMNINTNETQVYRPYKWLYLDLSEKQRPDDSWCSAYSTASIIRFIKGLSISECSAQQLMEWMNPGLPINDLKKIAFATYKVLEYSKLQGLNPVHTRGRVSTGHIQAQIDIDRPLYFILEYKNATNRHAVVCRGYYDTGDQINFSIWNPFYLEYETLNGSDFQYVSKGGSWYIWVETIHGF